MIETSDLPPKAKTDKNVKKINEFLILRSSSRYKQFDKYIFLYEPRLGPFFAQDASENLRRELCFGMLLLTTVLAKHELSQHP